MYKLVNVGDFMGLHSGFGGVNYNIYSRLANKYEIHQMGISYTGDYHNLQKDYKFYTTGDHPLGYTKFKRLINVVNPDIVTVTNDPWVAPEYITRLREIKPDTPAVLYCPVDSDGLSRDYVNILNQYNHVVTYTDWAVQELRNAGLTVPCTALPHGVDLDVFYPDDKMTVRQSFEGWEDRIRNGFIVSYIAQNSTRKRIDLYIYIIDEWLKRYPHEDVFFFYHGPLKRKGGTDIPAFINYLDQPHKKGTATHLLEDRFLIPTDDPNFVIDRKEMRKLYNITDVYLHVAAIEGFGMPISEAMACKVPVICPDYSAMSEWCVDENGPGVFFVPIDDKPDAITSQCGTVHKYINVHWAIEALEAMYQNKKLRDDTAERGYKLITNPKFNWNRIASEFDTIFSNLLTKGE